MSGAQDTTTAGAPARGADRALRDRAARVVPGGMYGHLSAAGLPPGFPQFFARGEGSRVWDVDGNEYVDLMCSWGPILLGHRDPAVEEAVAAQLRTGDCLNGPGALFVETAELLVDTVEHADWAMFAKNGTDATTTSVLIARAATGRRKVLVARGSYHGVATWSSNGAGLTPEDRANTIAYEYNDLRSVEEAVAQADGDVAAIVATPLRHDIRRDLEEATPEFAEGLRRICDRIGAALVLDEVRAGLRVAVGGSWEPLGVRPDLSAWSKGIANGHPISAVVGCDALRDAAREIVVTGSFWFAAAPMAAAATTIRLMRESDAAARMERAGRLLRDGLARQAEAHGLTVTLSGPVQMPFLSFAGDDDFSLASLWADTAVANGTYVHPTHNWFVNAALDDDLVARALDGTDPAFAAVAGAIEGGAR